MDIGIGLPNPIPLATGDTLLRWAEHAEDAGFSTLATIDRLVYPGFESLVALAGAAAVTKKIGLMTNILIAPLRDATLLAKQAASVDRLSDGRLRLGLSVGGRRDDYDAVGKDFATRGRQFDKDLEAMHELWAGKTLSETNQASVPSPGRPVRILFGGTNDAVIARTVRWGEGWTAGGGGPDMAGPFIQRVRDAWDEAGREGKPRIVALSYFGLGPRAREGIEAYIGDYYEFLGPWAERIAESALATPQQLTDMIARFEDLGVDELVFDPTIAELDQVDMLAEAVL